MKNSIRLISAILVAILCGSSLAACANNANPPVTEVTTDLPVTTEAAVTTEALVTTDAPITTETPTAEATTAFDVTQDAEAPLYLGEDGYVHFNGASTLVLPNGGGRIVFEGKNAAPVFVTKTLYAPRSGCAQAEEDGNLTIIFENGDKFKTSVSASDKTVTYFSDKICAIAANDSGHVQIISTSDGGKTHSQFELEIGDKVLFDIGFVSDKVGYLIICEPYTALMGVHFYTLYRTTDGGKTFTCVNADKTANGAIISGEIHFIDENRAFSGKNERLFATACFNLAEGADAIWYNALENNSAFNFKLPTSFNWMSNANALEPYFEGDVGIWPVEIQVENQIYYSYFYTTDGGHTWLIYSPENPDIVFDDIRGETSKYPSGI